MGGINLTVHPLFFAFGFYYALTGRIFLFVIYTVSAILHELGHSLVASGLGYRLKKITLMPFGAVVSNDQSGMKTLDEIKIALAGPFLNLAVALFFVATWWLLPETYAFTDTVVQANFSLAIVNFLPVYPLDGGRVLTSFLILKTDKRRAKIVQTVLGVVTSIVLIACFIFTLFNTVNFSLLFFALFVTFGAFGKNKDNFYVKMYTALDTAKLARGMPYKRQALDKSASVKKMMSMLDDGCVNEIVVFSDQRPIKTLSHSEIVKIIEKGELYSRLENYI